MVQIPVDRRSSWINEVNDPKIKRFPISNKLDQWEKNLSTDQVPVRCEPLQEKNFAYGALAHVPIADITCGFVEADEHRAIRTTGMTRKASQGFYKFGVQRTGTSRLSQDGRQVVLSPGDVSFYDTSRPHEFIADQPMSMVVYTIPRYSFRDDPQVMSNLTAIQISGADGLGSLASSFLLTLPTKLEQSGLLLRTHLSETLISLVGAVLSVTQGHEGLTGRSSPELLRLSVQDTIRKEIKNPELSPAWLAQKHHVSLRYLYRAFENADRSVTQHIRKLRLENCKSDLRSIALQDETILSVASQWGFVDAAHFSRIFKQEYGLSPREYRLASRNNNAS